MDSTEQAAPAHGAAHTADHRHEFEDLTARARIRDAALRLFAERGIAGAAIRDIAAAAGVSPGLVRHHFGSKEALRAACDAYALQRATRIQEELIREGGLADTGFVVASHPTIMLLQRYLVRSLMDGSPAATAMFDDLVGYAERWLTERGVATDDLRAYAAALVVLKLGVFVLDAQFSRALGEDVHAPAGHARMTRGLVDVFATPLLTAEQAAQARAALDGLVSPPRRDRAGGVT
jgi:AcrR family transcriptional regulator